MDVASRAVTVVGWAFLACSLALVPWTVYLALTLPDRLLAAHVALAWSGFDVGLFVALAWTAWTSLRGSQWMSHAAVATATLLVVDAWFDVVTSATMGQRLAALALAVLVELPLASVCAWLAVTGQALTEHRLARRFSRRSRRG